MGLPMWPWNASDPPALGAAIIAGYAVGIYDDMAATAERLTQRRAPDFRPNPARHAFYWEIPTAMGACWRGPSRSSMIWLCWLNGRA